MSFKYKDVLSIVSITITDLQYTLHFSTCVAHYYLCIFVQFSYIDMDENPVHVVQLTFLKLLSATAKQRFTYTCQNSAGWFDSASRSYQHALRFRGSNYEELTQAKSPFIHAVHDGCQVSAGICQGTRLVGQIGICLNETDVYISCVTVVSWCTIK